MTQRVDKIKEALKEEVSRILHGEINDPRIGFVTITRVEVTPDLRLARIYFSVMRASASPQGGASAKKESPKFKEKTEAGLKSATGYVRKLISERLKLRYTPELLFVFDDSIEYSQRMSDLIKKAREKDKEISDEEIS